MKQGTRISEKEGDDLLRPLLTRAERRIWDSLTSPVKIQDFLDYTVYSGEETYRSPLRVLRERKAHCFDGAVFAPFLIPVLEITCRFPIAGPQEPRRS